MSLRVIFFAESGIIDIPQLIIMRYALSFRKQFLYHRRNGFTVSFTCQLFGCDSHNFPHICRRAGSRIGDDFQENGFEFFRVQSELAEIFL